MMSTNDNCWWDAADDDQRRQFTRLTIRDAMSFHRWCLDNVKLLRAQRSAMEALQADIASAGPSIGPTAKDVVAEMLRSLDEALAIEVPEIDWADRMACVRGELGT